MAFFFSHLHKTHSVGLSIGPPVGPLGGPCALHAVEMFAKKTRYPTILAKKSYLSQINAPAHPYAIDAVVYTALFLTSFSLMCLAVCSFSQSHSVSLINISEL